MRFAKLEALGNDFILVEARARPDRCDALARAVCDRRRGVGADGLLVVLPGGPEAEARVEVWNADGSEAQTSGNGLRCVARRLATRRGARALRLATRAGIASVRIGPGDGGAIRVPLGVPRFRAEEIPFVDPDPTRGARAPERVIEARLPGVPLPVIVLSLGNPHAVMFVDGAVEAARLGPLVESHAAFPERTNVEFVRVVAPDRLIALFWERGAGPTASSGTGAAAALVAAAVAGRAARRARVEMEGGALEVGWDDDGVWTEGPARFVFEGEWPE
jgi:diaminopimelate epimerase